MCLPGLWVRVRIAGPRRCCGKSPFASAWSERAVRGSPGFFVRPSCFLFARKEGWFLPRPLVCELKSLGLGNVLQEESLSLCTEQEGRQGFS